MVDGEKRLAALLVDFENLYYFIKKSPGYKGHDTMEVIVRLIQQLRDYLDSEFTEATISLDAYADFEQIEENAQGDLYLLGFDTHNVLGTEHKNAADMKLCIDAMEILYTRPEISTFVLIAGDRDYIPVIQHLKRKAKVVRVVGFQGSMSGDLLTTLGQRYFVDGQQFLHQFPQNATTKPPEPPEQVKPSIIVLPPGLTKPGASAILPRTHMEIATPLALPGAPSLPLKSPEEYKKVALGVVFKYFKGKPEIWMAPYLHKLRSEVPELSEPERKAIISRLNESGAITIETRTGEMHDYTVFKLNWNHPDVRQAAQ
jgi:uncharacterized LabA/DUF88 family protein